MGEYTGYELTILPSQLISFDQFRETYPYAEVLSRDTGHHRNYGENPYAGYDDINNSPLLNDEHLEFEFTGGDIKDVNTGSIWNISGKAVSGPLEGEQLETKIFGDYFAFAWLVFYPDTEMVQ